jgi:hypothetical protein
MRGAKAGRPIMAEAHRRDPLTPWYIGIGFLLVMDAVFFYFIATRNCEVPSPIVFGIMVILPAVYLAVMYLAFRSQK